MSLPEIRQKNSKSKYPLCSVVMYHAESTKEAEQLREVALQERSRVKEVELKAEKWAEQTRKLQTEAEAQSQEMLHLKQDRLRNQETVNR